MSDDSQKDSPQQPYKTGDYTPLEGLPLARRGYADDVLKPLDRQMSRTQRQIDTTVDEIRERESGIVGTVKKLAGRDDAQSALVQGLNASLKLDAARDNVEEHLSTAYPVLAAPRDDARVDVKTIKTSADEIKVTKPALIPETQSMYAAELQSHNAAHSRAITIAKAEAEERQTAGEPPIVANVQDSHYAGTVRVVSKKVTR
jgi:hypothetical protein